MTVSSHGAVDEARLAIKRELNAIYSQGCKVYHGQHDRDGGMAIFKQLEQRAIELGDNELLGSAYWKQAQVIADDGDISGSIVLFRKAEEAMRGEERFVGSANHLMLLSNLFGSYESLGSRGESLKIRHELFTATWANMSTRWSKTPPSPRLLEFTDEELLAIPNMAFIGILFKVELFMRKEAGDDAGAIELAECLDRRFRGTVNPREATQYGDVLEYLYELYLAAGRHADARDVLEHLIELKNVKGSETASERLSARINLAWLRCSLGEESAPLLAEAETVVAEAKAQRRIGAYTSARKQLARMYAMSGDVSRALREIEGAIVETRELDLPKHLAQLLIARAAIRLDAGLTEGVESDLFEALKWYRSRGGLRAETSAYVHYVRYLRMTGRMREARQMLSQATTRLGQFRDMSLGELLETETRLIGGGPLSEVPSGFLAVSDLQPIELTTVVPEGIAAMGRFTVTNAGSLSVNGLLRASGTGLKARWDEVGLKWIVSSLKDGKPGKVSQTMVLEPMDQIIVELTADVSAASAGEIELTWRGEAETQSVWWRYSAGALGSDIAVVDANLAMENPFYSVPLHHFILRSHGAGDRTQNLRVKTTVPSRIELVDPDSGRVIAVDASGDGGFSGAGDVVFDDRDQNGWPDIFFGNDKAVRTLEIQVYPLADSYDEIGVHLQLQSADGTWALQSTDRMFGKN